MEALECFKATGDAKRAARSLPPSAHNLQALLRVRELLQLYPQGVHRFGCASLLQKEALTEQDQALLCMVLKELPSEMIRFYVKALQSLLFNRSVQWRVQTYGTQVLLGDLVLKGDKVSRVSQEDLDAHCYSVYDVVLPLFG